MGAIISTIEKQTNGKSYKSYRYCHSTTDRAGIEYDDNANVEWKDFGETEQHKKSVDLRTEADKRKFLPSVFTYFLDGSRHTYKIDDISYNKNVYPIIAGQIGIGCCKRIQKELIKEKFNRKMVMVLPDIAFRDPWDRTVLARDLLKQINETVKLKRFGISFDSIKLYDRSGDVKLEDKAVSKIQDFMVELEKNMVADLVTAGKLNQDNYLIKDGSLEYQKVSPKNNQGVKNLSDKKVAKNYHYVIGVSKSFDPTKCFIKGGGSNSDIIANLKPFHRTPAYMFESTRSGNDVKFCVWYIRLCEAKYTKSVFDGVIKVEKLIVKDSEKENGVPSEEIDNLSAFLLNERNPVCYGADGRWANHIYPVYLTESFVKSKYLSNDLFMQLF
ncbi:hypothetical protein [Acetobacterium malicum]|uniref:hypothetical protein n=1 Tax=Acetobacterium malicum TaxID=52692 RepID=UPI00041EF004|nr:hypothetical protein [Acetobacterium dehalogenans]